MQPSVLFKLLLHQSLTTVIRYYMVFLRTWLNSSDVCRMQLLVLLLFRPSSVILHLFLRIFTGSQFMCGLNLKYLSLPASLSMDLLLLILKIFFKVTSRHGILGLHRKIYLSCLLLTLTVMAVELFLLLRRFFGTVFLSILGMLDHWTFLKDSWKLFFLNWLRDCGVFIPGLKLFCL